MLFEDGAGLVLHADHIRRVYYFHFIQGNTVLPGHPADLGFIAGQQDGMAIFLRRLGGAADNFQRGVVPAKSIDDHSHLLSSFPI